jgi:CheY-like chemotaxis protein
LERDGACFLNVLLGLLQFSTTTNNFSKNCPPFLVHILLINAHLPRSYKYSEVIMDNADWGLIKVLVVDDEKTTLKLMEKFIEKIGCVGVYVENGKQAVDMIKNYNFDLCFMDLFMPEMGGIEATTIIREDLNEKLPIIAITSSTMESDKEKCLDIGMNDYIQKPLKPDIIKEHVSKYGVKK